MDTQIIQVYCLYDVMLKAMQHDKDVQCRLSDAEVMTVAIVVALYYGGNFVDAGDMLSEQGYLPVMLSRSRYNRRLHRVKALFLTLFALVGEHFKAMNEESVLYPGHISQGSLTFPANFILVAAITPCPYGYLDALEMTYTI